MTAYTRFEFPQAPLAITATTATKQTGAVANVAIVAGPACENERGANRPSTVSTRRWQQVLADAAYVRREWTDRAVALGWSALDLFGADRRVPDRRYDRMGLCWSLRGRRVVALTAEAATIATPTGGTLTYYRRRVDPAVVADFLHGDTR